MSDPILPSIAALCLRSAEDIMIEGKSLTNEQISLAWSPEPPRERFGPFDCRRGGDCGIDLSGESCLSRWRAARFRWLRQRRKEEHGR
jgi:hypothetical protein